MMTASSEQNQELIGEFTPEFYYNKNDRKEVLAKLKKYGYLKNYEVQIWPIEELEKYFTMLSIKDEAILLDNHLTINNPCQFIETHLRIVKSNNNTSSETSF